MTSVYFFVNTNRQRTNFHSHDEQSVNGLRQIAWASGFVSGLPTGSHTAPLSRFPARCRSSFQLHNRHSRLLGGSPVNSLHSHTVPLVQWSTRLLPVLRGPGSIPRGYLSMWNWDSPVSIVSLPIMRDPGSNPQGGTYVKLGFLLLALSRYTIKNNHPASQETSYIHQTVLSFVLHSIGSKGLLPS
jgi:hypothetical protein